MIAHNGEINTIWSNRAHVDARAPPLPRECEPFYTPDASDSMSLDEVAELLCNYERNVAEAVRMMLPPAIGIKESAFHRYHADCMEPWDGPSALVFTDGTPAGRGARSQRPSPLPLRHHRHWPDRRRLRSRPRRCRYRHHHSQRTPRSRPDDSARPRAQPLDRRRRTRPLLRRPRALLEVDRRHSAGAVGHAGLDCSRKTSSPACSAASATPAKK